MNATIFCFVAFPGGMGVLVTPMRSILDSRQVTETGHHPAQQHHHEARSKRPRH